MDTDGISSIGFPAWLKSNMSTFNYTNFFFLHFIFIVHFSMFFHPYSVLCNFNFLLFVHSSLTLLNRFIKLGFKTAFT